MEFGPIMRVAHNGFNFISPVRSNESFEFVVALERSRLWIQKIELDLHESS